MKIEQIKIEKLKPYERNSRKHPLKQIDLIVENIKRFGFTTPLLISKDNEIIAGHGRLEAALKIGMKNLPCVRMDNLSEIEVKALRIADNRLAELAEWDMNLAIDDLKGLDSDLLDLTGFDRDLIIEGNEQDDVIPENAPVIAKLGDIWQLGKHRVMCGDSTKKEDVEKLMDSKKADMVFTDPPYNVDYSGRGKETSNKIKNDNQTQEAFKEFLEKSFNNLREFLKAEGGGIHLLCLKNT